jgi:hypothetical protein
MIRFLANVPSQVNLYEQRQIESTCSERIDQSFLIWSFLLLLITGEVLKRVIVSGCRL